MAGHFTPSRIQLELARRPKAPQERAEHDYELIAPVTWFRDGICDAMDVVRGKAVQHCVAALTIAVLAGCAHPVPALHGHDVVISGWNTAQVTADVAARKVFSEASAITLDHGYRYFEILSPMRPGAKVTIRLYGAGEAPPASPNIHDATLVMINQPPLHEPSPEEDMIEH